MISRALWRTRKPGFTLIELLVVMAITAILLGLIFGPMIQGFNLTNRARIQVQAQDTARQIMEILERDTANGVFVFDHHLDLVKEKVNVDSPNAVDIWVRDINGNTQREFLPYGILDFVPPAQAADQNTNLQPSDIDPTTGLAIKRGDLSLPLAPGRNVHRWFIGLRNNISDPDASGNTSGIARTPYGNFYDAIQAINPAEHIAENLHNPALLYRVIFSPYMANLDNTGKAQVDTRIVHADANGNPILYDPNFYYDTSVAGTVVLPDGTSTNKVPGWKDENGDGLVNVCENWHALVRAMVPTDRADALTIDRDDNGNTNWDIVTGLPRLQNHASFQPTYVGNDAGNPSSFTDVGNEAPSVAPTSYREVHGAWTLPYRLYMFRSALNANPLQYFFDVGNGDIRYQEYDPVTANITKDIPANFILNSLRQLNPGQRPEIMFDVDVRKGLVNCSYPDSIVLHDPVSGKPYTSAFDPAAVNATFNSDYAKALDPNASGWPPGREQQIFRAVSLASLDPLLNSELSAGLHPPLEPQMDGRTYIPNVQITPGSEVVIGPDMIPGPHYGMCITYTRVPRNTDPRMIGPNEYMINYADVPNKQPVDPNDPPELQQMQTLLQSAGTILFDSQVDPPNQAPKHMIPEMPPSPNCPKLGSELNPPIQRIYVSYKIQSNKSSDLVKADYLTRDLMTAALGVRLFDFNSGQPQQVNLTQKIKVRNLQR